MSHTGMRFSVGSPRQNMPGARPTAPPQTATSTSSTTGSPSQGSGTGTQVPAGGPEPQFVQMLRTMLQSAVCIQSYLCC